VLATESLRCALHGGRLGRLLGADATLLKPPPEHKKSSSVLSKGRGTWGFGFGDVSPTHTCISGAERGRAGVLGSVPRGHGMVGLRIYGPQFHLFARRSSQSEPTTPLRTR
jgi:hypothetical protein